jgi:formylglycine-generating enzyme required for sulfatase activity
VLRGGAFISSERDVRVSNRAWAEPDAAYRFIGFRCVADEPEP